MNKKERDLLEKAFAKEVESALEGGPHLIPTRSKVANKLAEDGLLQYQEIVLHGSLPVTIKGYALTELGRMTYCMTC